MVQIVMDIMPLKRGVLSTEQYPRMMTLSNIDFM